jgi:hypothetical protein
MQSGSEKKGREAPARLFAIKNLRNDARYVARLMKPMMTSRITAPIIA